MRDECTELLAAEQRTEARCERLSISWLDVKLGMRMLARYPGLTIIGGLAMASRSGWERARRVHPPAHPPDAPIDEGDRVVGIWNIDAETNSQEYRALFDYANWRTNLTTP